MTIALLSSLAAVRSTPCELPGNAEFVSTKTGLRMAVRRGGDIVSATIRKTGVWEVHPWKALEPFMSPQTVFVDIGANIGWHTLNLARRGHDVVAFEPFASNIAMLNASLCANPSLVNRTLVKAHGLSNSAARCDLFQIPSINFGDTVSVCDGGSYVQQKEAVQKQLSTSCRRHCHRRADGCAGCASVQKLGEFRAYQLDDVVDESLLRAEKAVKMDVEGHEYKVLLGAERFFTQGNPPRAVYAEVFQLGAHRSSFFAKLKEWGYDTMARAKDREALFVRAVGAVSSQKALTANRAHGVAHARRKVRWACQFSALFAC